MTRTISNPIALGHLVRDVRRALGLRQPDLALSAGVGVRLLVDIEKGKATTQIGKVMGVLAALGVEMTLSLPESIEVADGRS